MATDGELSAVLKLINGWSPTALAAAVDDPDVKPDIEQLLSALGLATPPPTNGVLARLAEGLYEVFATPDSAAAVAALNGLVTAARLQPELTTDGLRWRHPSNGPTLRSVTTSVLIQHWMTDPSLDRLQICTGHHCADALVDRTQANNRRYCSLTCQNRTKTRDRRKRLRAAR